MPTALSHETQTFRIAGMTCSHCVMSVREEVSDIAGVAAVDVDLASGRLTVAGDGVAEAAIRAAVAEAGYEVAS
jgi:copper chaperone